VTACIFGHGFAQRQNAMVHDNYGGYIASQYNPANLADSRFQFNMNILGLNANLQNNYVQMELPHSMYKFLYWKLDSTFMTQNFDYPYYNNYITERLNGKDKYVYANATVNTVAMQFGLSDRTGVSFGFSTKANASATNVSQNGIKAFLEDFDTAATYRENQERLLGKSISSSKSGAAALAYQQYSGKFAAVVKESKSDFWKIGVGIDLNLGLFGAYYQGDDVNFTLTGIDTVAFTSTQMQLAYIDERYYSNPDRRLNDFFGSSRLGRGFGINGGFVYEHRENAKDYKYKMNGKRQEDRSENKYDWKIEGSIADLGYVKFDVPGLTRQRTIPAQSDTLVWADFDEVVSWKGTEDMDTFLLSFFNNVDTSTAFSIYTPAVLNLAGDYKLKERFYLNASYSQSLIRSRGRGVKVPSIFTFAPRYETRWFTASMPISISKYYNAVNVGAYVRAGLLYVGSDNLGGIFTPKKTNGYNLYAGINWPIHYNRMKDSDGDGISDEEDECPSFMGTKYTKGCPDADEDKVPDEEDLCPNEPGTKRTKGCPDPDNDGLAGADDLCPNVFGEKNNQGCPDSDGDGIHDGKDKCPDKAGEEKYAGCPEEFKKTTPPATKTEPKKAIDQSKFDNWDFVTYEYWPVLGAYNELRWAVELQGRLLEKLDIEVTIKTIPGVSKYYITLGEASTREEAIEIQKILDRPDVNSELNGTLWWKKVEK
jgi:hypothetical protein